MKKLHLILMVVSVMLSGCYDIDARRPVSNSSGSFIKTSAERNKALNAMEYERIRALIATDSARRFETSNSGFWYTYITANPTDSTEAGFGDTVEFQYDVKDLDGNIIYTADELGLQQYRMDQEELFTGLREGLKLMNPGETVLFLFPSELAFGYYGDENRIGTNIPIQCIVTLNSIIKHNNTQ